MIKIMNSFNETERKFETNAECFIFHHPVIGLFTVFIGMPIFIMAAVTISTVVIMLPLLLLLGWL